MKIIVNSCYGGPGLSKEAIQLYNERTGSNLNTEFLSLWGKESLRSDPEMVRVVEELGEAANGEYASLRIADVPDGIEWYIDDYDGIETVREEHRTW